MKTDVETSRCIFVVQNKKKSYTFTQQSPSVLTEQNCKTQDLLNSDDLYF